MTRIEIQTKITESIIQHDFEGILEASMRCGKSKAVLDALSISKYRSILICVPNKSVKESWEQEVIKWSFTKGVKIICFASIKNYIDSGHHVVIIDEAQLLSSGNLSNLSKYDGNKLFVSGFFNPSTIFEINESQGIQKIIYKYTVEEAINDGIISDYEICIHKVQLQSEADKKIYQKLTQDVERAKYSGNPNYFNMMAGKRAMWIYKYPEKIKKVHELLNKDALQKTLLFTCYQNQADKFCNSFHGANKHKDNLTKFQIGKIRKLSVIRLVEAGITIPGLKHILFHQIYSNSENSIQKAARALNWEDNQKALIEIVCLEGTQDTSWINKSLQSFNPKKLKWV